MKTQAAHRGAQPTQTPGADAAPKSNADQLLDWLFAVVSKSRKETKKDMQQWANVSGTPLQRAEQGAQIAERVSQRTTTENLLMEAINKITTAETKNARDLWKA